MFLVFDCICTFTFQNLNASLDLVYVLRNDTSKISSKVILLSSILIVMLGDMMVRNIIYMIFAVFNALLTACRR